jgi:hypothetical protein
MKTETRRQNVQTTPACWQREAPCPCLRVESRGNEMRLFPYQHLVSASFLHGEGMEMLRLTFSSHDVEIAGHNLRPLFLALQDFAVKWVRLMPERYRTLEATDDGLITEIRIEDAK